MREETGPKQETTKVDLQTAHEDHAHKNEIDYYTCTMHPSVKQQQPGTCPICAMDLVPVQKKQKVPESENVQKDARTINIPLYQQQLIGVQRDTVARHPTVKTIRTVGIVAYNEAKVATINLKFSGWIEKLYVNYTGQFMQKGQPLFEIYSPEVVATQEEYLQALKAVAQKNRFANSVQHKNGGNTLLASTRERLLLWGITKKQIRELESTRVPRLTVAVGSPITGYVVKKNVLQGGKAKEGTDLYTIADLSTLWVHADIYEYELPFIKVGQQAQITLTYDPKVKYTGKVDYIYPMLNTKTRTAKIRLIAPNPELRLKPEMYANVSIKVDLGVQLTVPETAVLNTGARQLVFVDRGNGRFEPREIELGTKVDRYYVVLKGLEEGEIVVKSGNFLIDAEAHVQGVLQSL